MIAGLHFVETIQYTAMLQTFVLYAMPFTFTLLVACGLAAVFCGLFLFIFRIRPTNLAFKHPYLAKKTWDSYPVSIRLAITLDYFFRIAFPKSKYSLIGNANRLLSDIDPNQLPNRIKWPLIGLWGGVFTGIIAMVTLWILVFLSTL